MEQYEVKITPFAEKAVLEIGQYIAVTLQSPQAAIHTLSLIRKDIQSLETMPFRFPLTPEEPWHSQGIRKMPVNHFLIYYWIDTERKTVHIIHVLYAKRDQSAQLAMIDRE